MRESKGKVKVLCMSALIAAAVLVLPPLVSANQATKSKTFAQTLVEQALATHSDADEVGIAVQSSHRCRTIASTDKSDVGEACEKDDIAPMRNGKPYVESEKGGFDVSVPLRDAQGEIIGSLGVGFKKAEGQTQESVIAQATRIAEEMRPRISSKAKLFEATK